MTIRDIRERMNLFIYDSKRKVLGSLSFFNVLVALTALGVLVYYYGFPQTEYSKEICFNIIEASFGFYIVRFLIKLFYNFNPLKYLRKNWFESIIIRTATSDASQKKVT